MAGVVLARDGFSSDLQKVIQNLQNFPVRTERTPWRARPPAPSLYARTRAAYSTRHITMGIENPTSDRNRDQTAERRTVVVRSADAVLAELKNHVTVDAMSTEALRVLLRVFRQNNRGNKVIVVGETQAIGLTIHAVEVRVSSAV